MDERPTRKSVVESRVALDMMTSPQRANRLIDGQGRPRPVPPLGIETPEEQLLFDAAAERRRKERHQREQSLCQRAASGPDEE